jgi:hypothetical protein
VSKPVAVVDGSNVALEEKTNDGKPKMENIARMRRALEIQGYRPIIITDARLKYDIDDKTQYERLEGEGIIHQAPAGTQADYFILTTAQIENGIVISNDQFHEWVSEFPWVEGRRIPFMIVDGNVEIHCPTPGEGIHHTSRNSQGRNHANP